MLDRVSASDGRAADLGAIEDQIGELRGALALVQLIRANSTVTIEPADYYPGFQDALHAAMRAADRLHEAFHREAPEMKLGARQHG